MGNTAYLRISCSRKALEMVKSKATIFSPPLSLASSASISLSKSSLENAITRAGYSTSEERTGYFASKIHADYSTLKMHLGYSACNLHLNLTTSLPHSPAD